MLNYRETHNFGTFFYTFECETWSLTLREEHRLRVLQNTVLRKVFGSKRDGDIGRTKIMYRGA